MRGKGYQTLKFGQLIVYKMRKKFLEKLYTQNAVQKLVPDPFLEN